VNRPALALLSFLDDIFLATWLLAGLIWGLPDAQKIGLAGIALVLFFLLLLVWEDIFYTFACIYASLTWERGQEGINEQFARAIYIPPGWKVSKQFVKDIGPAALAKIRDDPVLFARALLPHPTKPSEKLRPFPYQEKWLRDTSKRLVAICGRQIGKSTIAAAALVHFGVTHPKTTSIIVSSGLRQSIETFDKVLGFILDSPLKKSIVYKSRTRIVISNGARIICLPCGRYGQTLRGLTVHFAVLDEAPVMPEEVIAGAVLPMLATTDGRLWMIGTPWSKDHITYRALMDTQRWSPYFLPSTVCPLITKEYLEEQRVLLGEERFNREFLALFVDDAKAYFPMTLLSKNLHICEEYPCEFCSLYNNPKPGGRLFLGHDPGGADSYAAIVIAERRGECFPVRACIQEKMEKGEKEEEDARFYTRFTLKIADLHKSLSLERMGVDATGMGGALVKEHMSELGLPAEGFKLSAPVKEDLAARGKLLLEQSRVELPNDPALLNSLNCIEYERTRAGGFLFSHRKGTYDDLGWALLLMLKVAVEEEKGESFVV